MTSTLKLSVAQRALFDSHQHLVAQATARYGRKNRDDIAQEALIALANASRCYDASLETPFDAYARTCIKNRCLDFLKKPPQPKSSDDVVGFDEIGKPVTLFEKIEESGELEDEGRQSRGEAERDYVLHHAVNHNLSGMERRVIKLHFGLDDDNPLTLEEIAERVGISTTATHRVIQSALTELKKELKK